MKPGGWIQCHEVLPVAYSEDGTAGPDHPLNTVYDMIDEHFGPVYGWNMRFTHEIPKVLEETGFINIQERRSQIPVGGWHAEVKMREMGLFCQSFTEDFIAALLAKHDVMGLTEDEAEEFWDKVVDTFNNSRIHAQLDFLDCWAQKPPS